jgi:hypothetical protein
MRFKFRESSELPVHHEIKRWTVLHLPKRIDRVPLALSNAERLDVPYNLVRFWEAKDADDYASVDEIIHAAVSDGFLDFERIDRPSVKYPGRICQTWNVCRFLRDLGERDSVEMLIHDGMLIAFMKIAPYGFFPDFEFFCECVKRCQQEDTPFQMLVLGDLHAHYGLNPIEGGSAILYGIGHESNSVRIYSSLGARNVLDRIKHRLRRGVYEADIMFRLDEDNDVGAFDEYWSLPGMYTLLYQPLAMDMPSDYLGSNTVDWDSQTGVYEDLFAKWRT